MKAAPLDQFPQILKGNFRLIFNSVARNFNLRFQVEGAQKNDPPLINIFTGSIGLVQNPRTYGGRIPSTDLFIRLWHGARTHNVSKFQIQCDGLWLINELQVRQDSPNTYTLLAPELEHTKTQKPKELFTCEVTEDPRQTKITSTNYPKKPTTEEVKGDNNSATTIPVTAPASNNDPTQEEKLAGEFKNPIKNNNEKTWSEWGEELLGLIGILALCSSPIFIVLLPTATAMVIATLAAYALGIFDLVILIKLLSQQANPNVNNRFNPRWMLLFTVCLNVSMVAALLFLTPHIAIPLVALKIIAVAFAVISILLLTAIKTILKNTGKNSETTDIKTSEINASGNNTSELKSSWDDPNYCRQYEEKCPVAKMIRKFLNNFQYLNMDKNINSQIEKLNPYTVSIYDTTNVMQKGTRKNRGVFDSAQNEFESLATIMHGMLELAYHHQPEELYGFCYVVSVGNFQFSLQIQEDRYVHGRCQLRQSLAFGDFDFERHLQVTRKHSFLHTMTRILEIFAEFYIHLCKKNKKDSPAFRENFLKALGAVKELLPTDEDTTSEISYSANPPSCLEIVTKIERQLTTNPLTQPTESKTANAPQKHSAAVAAFTRGAAGSTVTAARTSTTSLGRHERKQEEVERARVSIM